MRACALTLLAMGRDAWAFVAAVHFMAAIRGGRPIEATCASAWFRPCECVARCAFTRVAGWGGNVHARGLDASDYRADREVAAGKAPI